MPVFSPACIPGRPELPCYCCVSSTLEMQVLDLDGLDDLDGEGANADKENDGSEGKKGGSGLAWEGSTRDYHYEELLGRIFGILRANNPELAGEKTKTILKPPQVCSGESEFPMRVLLLVRKPKGHLPCSPALSIKCRKPERRLSTHYFCSQSQEDDFRFNVYVVRANRRTYSTLFCGQSQTAQLSGHYLCSKSQKDAFHLKIVV